MKSNQREDDLFIVGIPGHPQTISTFKQKDWLLIQTEGTPLVNFNPDYALEIIMRAETTRKSVPMLQSGSVATDFEAVSARNR